MIATEGARTHVKFQETKKFNLNFIQSAVFVIYSTALQKYEK